MLTKSNDLKGYKLEAVDGELGSVKEFYFDDRHWTVRYLVAETGNWLRERQVLLSPLDLGKLDKTDETIGVGLTKKQIEDSPSLDTDKPVSRQFEEAYNTYFGWPMYWDGINTWGNYPFLVQAREKGPVLATSDKTWNPYLRSTQDVSGHAVLATDGEIGHVEDFIVDTKTWSIRYLVIATTNWWPGRKVLVSIHWIGRISWDDATVFVNLTRDAIRTSPEFSEGALLTRDYEIGLHRHYHQPSYWE